MSGALLHRRTFSVVVHSKAQGNFTFTRTSGLQSFVLAVDLGWYLSLSHVDTKGHN